MRTLRRNDALDVRSVVMAMGWLRLAVGVVMLVRPALLARLLGVDSVTARNTGWLTQMVSSRELGLGVVALAAARTPGAAPAALLAQAVADGGDALALGLAVRRRRVSPVLGSLIAATALAGAVVETLTARRAHADG